MGNAMDRKDNNRTRVAYRLIVLFFLCALMLGLGIATIYHLSVPYVQKYRLGVLALFCTAGVMLCVAGVIFLLKEKPTFYKTVLSGIVFILFFLVLLEIAEWTDFITVIQSPTLYERFLQRAGIYMPYIYIALQIVQVLFLPIPGVLSIFVGIKLFGTFLAVIYSFLGIALGSILAFWVGRKWGNKAVAWLIGEENLLLWQKRIQGKDHLLLTAMFILPFFPDDILCFVSGVSTMSARYFIIMMLIARAVGVFSTAYSVDLIPFDTWWGVVLWTIVLVPIIILMTLWYKNFDKINAYIKERRAKR